MRAGRQEGVESRLTGCRHSSNGFHAIVTLFVDNDLVLLFDSEPVLRTLVQAVRCRGRRYCCRCAELALALL